MSLMIESHEENNNLQLVWEMWEDLSRVKGKLTVAIVSILPNDNKEFKIYIDDSKYDLGYVMQKMIRAYVSRKLKPHDKNYVTHDMELVLALMIWWHYLHGNKCKICMDHESI